MEYNRSLHEVKVSCPFLVILFIAATFFSPADEFNLKCARSLLFSHLLLLPFIRLLLPSGLFFSPPLLHLSVPGRFCAPDGRFTLDQNLYLSTTIDFSKAFKCVCRPTLSNKFGLVDLFPWFACWTQSFLF